MIRSPGSPRGREGSGALKKEIGVWSSQGREKDKHFSLSPELMIAQQNNSFSEFSSVQSLSRVQLFVTPWTAAHQASLYITNSQSLLQLMSFESVTPSKHLILCRPLLLPPSIFPSIRVFSNESVLHIRWPKYWGFSFSISPSDEYSGLISWSWTRLSDCTELN